MAKKGLVIATNRPDDFGVFLFKWKDRLKRNGVPLYVMVDEVNDKGSQEIVHLLNNHGIYGSVYNHEEVRMELHDDSWIIPQGSSACKSYPIYKAWEDGCEIIYVLDDDCFPPDGDFFREHEKHLNMTWGGCLYPTMRNIRPRGTPYGIKEQIMISHGLWEENADVDAMTDLACPREVEARYIGGGVPHGALFPMSGMNVAFRGEAAPLMYFGLQGEGWPYDRFDDIWCGFIAKRILDHLGYAVMSGEPTVVHSKASDPFVNIVKEAPGYKANRDFYLWIRDLSITWTSFIECVKEIAGAMVDGNRVVSEIGGDPAYWRAYGEALGIWTKLFKEG